MKKFALIVLLTIVGCVVTADIANKIIVWDACPIPCDVVGYRVYFSHDNETQPYTTDRMVDVGMAFTCPMTLIPSAEGANTWIVATAYDQEGNESGYSNEVFFSDIDTMPPDPPQNLRIETI